VLRRQFQFIPLFGQSGQIVMRREICRRQIESLFPALDPGPKRTVDILESPLRRDP
jgi:hypothetical protein